MTKLICKAMLASLAFTNLFSVIQSHCL